MLTTMIFLKQFKLFKKTTGDLIDSRCPKSWASPQPHSLIVQPYNFFVKEVLQATSTDLILFMWFPEATLP